MASSPAFTAYQPHIVTSSGTDSNMSFKSREYTAALTTTGVRLDSSLTSDSPLVVSLDKDHNTIWRYVVRDSPSKIHVVLSTFAITSMTFCTISADFDLNKCAKDMMSTAVISLDVSTAGYALTSEFNKNIQ